MTKTSRALRYSSAAAMPPTVRAAFERQHGGYRPVAPAAPEKRGSKYAARATVVDGIRFDSKAEARYYQRLQLRVQAGEVRYFLRQVPIHLPGNTKYVVDFVEFHADGAVHFVDVKGVETQMFRLKKRQVESLYPITIEVTK